MRFKVGYAQAIITPSLAGPVYLAGFGRNRRAESVHDQLYARALALKNDGRFLIIVALDLLGLPRGQCQAVAQRVARLLPGAQLLIACTHTHHGPDILGLWGPDAQSSGVDEALIAGMLERVVETAVAAATDLHGAQLASASVNVPGVAKNTRDPHITDVELSCLQFRAGDGKKPLATWLIFPCHPEVLWDENPHITSDYLYVLRQRVEAETGAPCLVHVGALGGMMTPDVVDHSFAEAATMGNILADAALSILGAATGHPVTDVRTDRLEFSVPMENPLFDMAVAAGLLPKLEKADGTVRTEATLLRLNDSWLLAVPGELLPKLGLLYRKMLKEAGAAKTAVIGLANDELGYILPAEDFIPPENYLEPGDSYEESMSIGRKMGPCLTQAVHNLLRV